MRGVSGRLLQRPRRQVDCARGADRARRGQPENGRAALPRFTGAHRPVSRPAAAVAVLPAPASSTTRNRPRPRARRSAQARASAPLRTRGSTRGACHGATPRRSRTRSPCRHSSPGVHRGPPSPASDAQSAPSADAPSSAVCRVEVQLSSGLAQPCGATTALLESCSESEAGCGPEGRMFESCWARQTYSARPLAGSPPPATAR